ncbi:MAG: DNA-directed RNA polymerase subunit delta [Acholeplasmatales bacterium]|nr:DNA-directed RNA polymerase subunit delta [Acholeplasmatales bacterium]
MENYSELSLLEVAVIVLQEKGAPINIYELIEEVLNRKGLVDDEKKTLTTKLYVDITTSSKFVFMGENNWDLKLDQSLDQFDKDGSAFNSKDAYIEEDEEEESDYYDDEDEDDLDEEDEDEDEDSDEDSDEDEDDLDEDEDDEDDLNDDDIDDDLDDDLDSDEEFKEDKYNKYMDDYEDMYEDN